MGSGGLLLQVEYVLSSSFYKEEGFLMVMNPFEIDNFLAAYL